MPTFNQIARTTQRKKKKRNVHAPALNQKPQRKTICLKVFNTTPRKPNSALRKVAAVRYRYVRKYSALRKRTFAFIPGEDPKKDHGLKEHGVALMRGGRTKDLPGMKYKLMRGIYDLRAVPGRVSAPTKYGVRKRS